MRLPKVGCPFWAIVRISADWVIITRSLPNPEIPQLDLEGIQGQAERRPAREKDEMKLPPIPRDPNSPM